MITFCKHIQQWCHPPSSHQQHTASHSNPICHSFHLTGQPGSLLLQQLSGSTSGSHRRCQRSTICSRQVSLLSIFWSQARSACTATANSQMSLSSYHNLCFDVYQWIVILEIGQKCKSECEYIHKDFVNRTTMEIWVWIFTKIQVQLSKYEHCPLKVIFVIPPPHHYHESNHQCHHQPRQNKPFVLSYKRQFCSSAIVK